MASFGAFWELILLQLNYMSYTHKPVSLDFGLWSLLLDHCVKKRGNICMTVPLAWNLGTRPPLSPGGYATDLRTTVAGYLSQSTWKLTIRHQVWNSTSSPVDLDAVWSNSRSEAYSSDL